MAEARAERAEAAATVIPELQERVGRAEGEAAALREQGRAEQEQAAARIHEAEAAQDAVRAELAEWTAGGPFARALRSFLNRRGRI